ncbi:hypothetical protein [Streptomyces sp. NPDC012510]|uniref:hypothetical protein n=1 Tax=Streptomyces sp. NPDC012510 TaxID=3364838 RepID=UPI0036F0CCE6
MSQPPYPPQQPQPSMRPQQQPYHPYGQAAPAQQPPGYGPMSGPVPGPIGGPGRPPTHPAPPFQPQPFGRRPGGGGHPVGAVFLGFAVSVVISLFYSGLIVATYEDQTFITANALYLGHALLNGAVVGSLVGLVGGRGNGARVFASLIAMLGAFFGYANAVPLVFAFEETPKAAWDLIAYEPFLPAKAWWTDEVPGGVDWFSPLGLIVAAATAWGLAYAIGVRRRRG